MEHDLLKLNLTALDKMAKTEGPEASSAFSRFYQHIKPGGTGEPRLSVSKRED